MSEFNTIVKDIPIIALRGLVLFPKMVLHFDVGRKKSISALKNAMEHSQHVFLISQKNVLIDDPAEEDLFTVGVVANIKQMIKIPNSENMRVVVEGVSRASLIGLSKETPFLVGDIDKTQSVKSSPKMQKMASAFMRTAKEKFEVYASLSGSATPETVLKTMTLLEPGELADTIASNAHLDYTVKQKLLEELDDVKRLSTLCTEMEKENLQLEIGIEIERKVQQSIDANQREYYLREEIKILNDELGDGENTAEEAELYLKKIATLDVSEDSKEKLKKEAKRLMKMPSGSHEGTVVRTYLDTCLEIPFGVYKKESIDLAKAKKVLDKEHYGLVKVKERILEYIAVRKLAPDISGQIICLVGPPGVGKTSIAKSLAKAMGRNYVRISLGGIRDESDIRGHRKTYIGAMPGRIIASMKSAKSMNPMILLDEIDKLGFDGKGDPSSALLEALDPEQNSTFTDHFVDFPVDLSKVMFVTTANDLSTVPEPLLDRMEVIELYTYTHDEKVNIAKKHLIKKQTLRHGLSAKNLKITNDALDVIIENYTKEAGVRTLERTIAHVCRKAAMIVADDSSAKVVVNTNNLKDFLGNEKYKSDFSSKTDQVGVVNGLAWTRVGGTMLPLEVSVLEGTGKIKLTGSLGDVMQESAQTAVSYIRSQCSLFNIDSEFYKTKDIHIHAPESAIPKDGPSAGVAITTAIVSELAGVPINHEVAMTGEISLKGNVLPIGGLREKSMAAYRAGIKKVIIPFDNISDLDEIDNVVKENVEFYPAKNYKQVLSVAFDKFISSEPKLINKTKKLKFILNDAKMEHVVAQ